MKKGLSLVLFSVLLISLVSAVWWNPMDWGREGITGNVVSGSVYSNSFTGNSGGCSVNGGAVLTSDKDGSSNSAYSFDGVNDYLTCGDVGDVSGDASFSFWVKRDQVYKGGYIISKNTDSGDRVYAIQISDTRLIRLYNQPDNSRLEWSGIYPADTSWHHIALVINGKAVSLYFDGVKKSTKYFSNNFVGSSSAPLAIGARNPGDFYFPGAIDEVMIYNMALGPSEVSELYSGVIEEEVECTTSADCAFSPPIKEETYCNAEGKSCLKESWKVCINNQCVLREQDPVGDCLACPSGFVCSGGDCIADSSQTTECVNEGGELSISDISAGKICCSGLTKVTNSWMNTLGDCVEANSPYYCIKEGDGVCKDGTYQGPENICTSVDCIVEDDYCTVFENGVRKKVVFCTAYDDECMAWPEQEQCTGWCETGSCKGGTEEPVEEIPEDEIPEDEEDEISNGEEQEETEETECNGCLINNKCYAEGNRREIDDVEVYCDANEKDWNPQTTDGGRCYNNYECQSNFCSDNECYNVRNQVDFMGRFFCGLIYFWSSDERADCYDRFLAEDETDETPETPECGNGIVESGEECDDGNFRYDDGCSDCTLDSNLPGECFTGTILNDYMPWSSMTHWEECEDHDYNALYCPMESGSYEPEDPCVPDLANRKLCFIQKTTIRTCINGCQDGECI